MPQEAMEAGRNYSCCRKVYWDCYCEVYARSRVMQTLVAATTTSQGSKWRLNALKGYLKDKITA